MAWAAQVAGSLPLAPSYGTPKKDRRMAEGPAPFEDPKAWRHILVRFWTSPTALVRGREPGRPFLAL